MLGGGMQEHCGCEGAAVDLCVSPMLLQSCCGKRNDMLGEATQEQLTASAAATDVCATAAAAELLRENKRMLDKAIRELDRERAALQTQEKRTVAEIKKTAKQGQMVSARAQ